MSHVTHLIALRDKTCYPERLSRDGWSRLLHLAAQGKRSRQARLTQYELLCDVLIVWYARCEMVKHEVYDRTFDV